MPLENDPANAGQERKRLTNRVWREANAEHVRAQRQAWKRANPERVREHDRSYQRRLVERRRTAADATRKAEERRVARNARVRADRAANPERERTRSQRWREANPEKAAAMARRSYDKRRDRVAELSAAARDASPELHAARGAAWRAAHPDASREYQRDRRKDPEKYAEDLKRVRDYNRVKKRLERLGLPPARRHRTLARDRRVNDRAAAVFFTSPAARARHAQLAQMTSALDDVMTEQGPQWEALARAAVEHRARVGLSPRDLLEEVNVRAVAAVLDRFGEFDQLTSRDVQQALTTVRDQRARSEYSQQQAALRANLVRMVKYQSREVVVEARMENHARSLAGLRPLDVGVLVHQIAAAGLRESLGLHRLGPTDVEKIAQSVHEKHPTRFHPVGPPAVRTDAAPGGGGVPAARRSNRVGERHRTPGHDERL